MPPLKKKLKQSEFYCVSCQKRVKEPIDCIGVNVDKAGKPRLRSMCHLCDTYLYKYIKLKDEKKMLKKYGKY
jgi:hypothetical protein